MPKKTLFQQRLPGMDEPTDPKATGKSVESLRNSRQRAEDLEKLFKGDIPSSVMKVKRDEMGTDAVLGSYEESGWNDFKNSTDPNEARLHKAFTISGRGAANGALSIFARNICRTAVLLYSNVGDMVVDPFIGHNSRFQVCIEAGRNYHGYDVSKRFMKDNLLIAEELQKQYKNIKLELNEHTSEEMIYTPDEYGDFTITSPPYWDIEDYGDEPEQLGKWSKTYDEFMSKMAKVAKENYRTLKKDAFAAWYINDFRRDGVFYSYHIDTKRILEEAGFTMWDIMIVDLGRAFRESFISQIVEQKILPKRHEYGVIVRK